ncbi:phosphoglycerate kinase [Candidatus Woesearchaeota archaeon]|nr:phosphoglycerate kinase [Candidatus Woesearchaeota archaeon]
MKRSEMMKSLNRVKLENKRVLLRLDLDVPIDSKGNIKDDSRLRESLDTLKFLKKAKQVIIMGHMGRPKAIDNKLKLDKVAKRLSKLAKIKIKKINNFDIPKDKYVMLENLRFYEEEKKNDTNFSKCLASLADIYVNDAFAVSHRKCASIVGVTKHIKSYPGLKLKRDVDEIFKVTKNIKKPFILVLGGAKIDKLNILKNLVKKADHILIGGAMMFTFLKAQGYEVGKSKCDDHELNLACKLLSKKVILPIDVILNDGRMKLVGEIPKNRSGYDIGPMSVKLFSDFLNNAKTIIWNGPMGLFELKPFDKATKEIAKIIVKSDAKSLVGGGDTLYSIKKYSKKFTYSCTAGGAFLELISGKKLEGIKALEK